MKGQPVTSEMTEPVRAEPGLGDGVEGRPRSRKGAPSARRVLGDVGERYALFIVWLVVIAFFSVMRPHIFPTESNVSSILGSQSVLVFLALALLSPLTAGDFDLSVAYTLTFSSLVVAVLNTEDHVPVLVAIVAALAVGFIIGLLNGILVVIMGIDSFIATLGVGTFVGGLSLWISNSTTIGGVSQGLINWVVADRILGIPLEFYYGIALALILWYWCRFTPGGRRLLVVGRNREIARLSGIRVGRVRIGALTVAGVVSAFAGVVAAGTSGAADPTSALSLLLPAFAAVFLGATAISPGRFNVWGTVAGVYFLVTGITGLELLGFESYVQELFYGGALVVAVGLSVYARRRVEATGVRRAGGWR